MICFIFQVVVLTSSAYLCKLELYKWHIYTFPHCCRYITRETTKLYAWLLLKCHRYTENIPPWFGKTEAIIIFLPSWSYHNHQLCYFTMFMMIKPTKVFFRQTVDFLFYLFGKGKNDDSDYSCWIKLHFRVTTTKQTVLMILHPPWSIYSKNIYISLQLHISDIYFVTLNYVCCSFFLEN